MGKDIHAILEIKNGNEWGPIPDIPELLRQRCYDIFEMLERTGKPGVPEELEDKAFRQQDEGYYEVDFSAEDHSYFGYAYTTLGEIRKYIARYEDDYYISEKFYDYILDEKPELASFMISRKCRKDGNKLHFSVRTKEDDSKLATQKDLCVEIERIAKQYGKSEDEIRTAYYFDW